MSLYPLTLKLKVALRKLGILLHLEEEPLPHPPNPTLKPLYGLCARYHAGYDFSPTNLVIRAAVESPAQLQGILISGAKVIALVEKDDLDLVASLGTFITNNPPGVEGLVGIELGNEIDLTNTSAKDFGLFVSNSCSTLRHQGFKGDIISGGVSRVRPDTLKWLKEALSWCNQDILVGIHRYSIGNDATKPQDGYVNRADEANAILKVVGGRQVAITEFGYPVLDGISTNSAVINTRLDKEYFWDLSPKYVIYYQWLNGPANTPIDRFGIKDRPEILSLL